MFISKSQASSNDGGGGADEEKLSIIYETLRRDLPQFFVSNMDYRNVHKDIVFENRFRGKIYQLVSKKPYSHENHHNKLIVSFFV